MKVVINAVKFSPEEKLQNFVNEKVGKLERLLPEALQADVTLKVDKPETNNNKIAAVIFEFSLVQFLFVKDIPRMEMTDLCDFFFNCHPL